MFLAARSIAGWRQGPYRANGHLKLAPDVLMIHTDQGNQYCGADFRDLLRKQEITSSLSARGCWCKNPIVEIFDSTRRLDLSLDDCSWKSISSN
jgi:transposase InsO family protein